MKRTRWVFSNEEQITARLLVSIEDYPSAPTASNYLLLTVYIRGRARYLDFSYGRLFHPWGPVIRQEARELTKTMRPLLPPLGTEKLTEENLQPIQNFIETLIRLKDKR